MEAIQAKSIRSSNYSTGNRPKLKVLQRVLTDFAMTCSQLTPSHLILTHFSTGGNLYLVLVILLINLDTINQQSFHEFFLLHKDPFFVYIRLYNTCFISSLATVTLICKYFECQYFEIRKAIIKTFDLQCINFINIVKSLPLTEFVTLMKKMTDKNDLRELFCCVAFGHSLIIVSRNPQIPACSCYK